MTQKPSAISAWGLGAPLYMPANRRDIIDIANGEKFSMLRAMIFCTEDAVSNADVHSCVRHLGLCLQGFRNAPQRYRFIRARNPDILARLLELPNIDKIDGFVLPKFTLDNFNAYFEQLKGRSFHIMPTLETREVFDGQAMTELRQALLQSELLPKILMLRIGGNDLMNLLGIRRPRTLTVYDTPLGHSISQLVTLFKPYGFALSAPVFEYLDDTGTLQKEIALDLAHGLTGKTAIHPKQIATIEAAYAVDHQDYEMALSVTNTDAPAVFKMHNAMCEVATHRQWGENIMNRQQCYGVHNALLKEYAELSN
ncbi:MAG: HpcH/HpaI aldolase/citrate lyase family protein [Methylococcales bacterium]